MTSAFDALYAVRDTAGIAADRLRREIAAAQEVLREIDQLADDAERAAELLDDAQAIDRGEVPVVRGDGGTVQVVPRNRHERMLEEGRRLASEREDLVAQGVDPAQLEVPLAPALADDDPDLNQPACGYSDDADGRCILPAGHAGAHFQSMFGGDVAMLGDAEPAPDYVPPSCGDVGRSGSGICIRPAGHPGQHYRRPVGAGPDAGSVADEAPQQPAGEAAIVGTDCETTDCSVLEAHAHGRRCATDCPCGRGRVKP